MPSDVSPSQISLLIGPLSSIYKTHAFLPETPCLSARKLIFVRITRVGFELRGFVSNYTGWFRIMRSIAFAMHCSRVFAAFYTDIVRSMAAAIFGYFFVRGYKLL